jgi:hypothetical protein
MSRRRRSRRPHSCRALAVRGAFAALARSSPWRWSTLRFSVRRGLEPDLVDPVRAWLRRPDGLRVETVDGRLMQIVRETGQCLGGRGADDAGVRAPLRVLTAAALARGRPARVRGRLRVAADHVPGGSPGAARRRHRVCVSTEELGGPTPGRGHDLRIEAVDEPMGDDLFGRPRRGLFRRQ